eukprot:sb/3474515/
MFDAKLDPVLPEPQFTGRIHFRRYRKLTLFDYVDTGQNPFHPSIPVNRGSSLPPPLPKNKQELLHYVFIMRGSPALNGSFLADFYGIQCGCYGNQSSCYGNQDSCYGNQAGCYHGNQGSCLGDPSWLISASIVPSS